MAGGEAVGAKLPRERHQVDELHPLVAQGAWHRSSPGGIFVGELVDHAGAEAAFIIEHIMGDAEPVADGLGVVDILARAARTAALHRFAMIVKLERHPDHLGARTRRHRRDHRRIDPAGHGDDDARLADWALKVEKDRAWRRLYPKFTLSA